MFRFRSKMSANLRSSTVMVFMAAMLSALMALPLIAQNKPLDLSDRYRPRDASVSYKPGDEAARIPLKHAYRFLLTNQVQINGQKVGHFIVDTGSSVTGLRRRYRRRIFGEPVQQAPSLRRRGGNLLRVNRLALSPFAIEPANIVILPPASMPPEMVGLLGTDVLSLTPFTVDYASRQLEFHDPRTFEPPEDAGPVKMHGSWNDGAPAVRIKIAGQSVLARVGTGTNIKLMMRPEAARKLIPAFDQRTVKASDRKPGQPSLNRSDAQFFASGKDTWVKGFSLELFGKKYDSIHNVHVRPLETNKNIKAVIGGQLLRDFEMTFSFKQKKIWVKRAPTMREKLAARQVKVGEPDFVGQAPIGSAAISGDLKAWQTLLEAGASIDWRTDEGTTLLHHAVEGGNLKIVRNILDRTGGRFVNNTNDRGITPLLKAADHGRTDMVSLLLEHGANPDRSTKYDKMPLDLAIKTGVHGCVKLLLDHGATIEKLSLEQGSGSALEMAAAYGDRRVFQLLMNRGSSFEVDYDSGLTILHSAAQGGDPWIIKKVFERRPKLDVDARTEEGNTPLMVAARNGHLKAVKLLLKRGADPDARSDPRPRHGMVSPLFQAAWYGHADIAATLIEAGASVNVRAATGQGKATPLTGAAAYQRREVVKVLLDNGAEVNAPGKRGRTALHIAALRGSPEIMRLLIEEGADIEAEASPPLRPLHFAAGNGRFKSVKVLLNHGATPDPKGPVKSPVTLAKGAGHQKIVELLKKQLATSEE